MPSLPTLLLTACLAQPAPHAQLEPVPKTAVTLTGGFWADWLETNRSRSIPATLHQCEITDRLANFERAAGKAPGEHEGYFFNDSDVYKIIEGASDMLALGHDPKLDAALDGIIADIAAAQEPDGYLNTYYTLAEPDRKWTDIRVRHELYCAGHLFEAAVAHHEATGKRTLLEVAIRLADLIDRRFGPGADPHPPGHQQIEMGLIRLYRHTGEERYLRLAQFFLEARGRSEGRELFGPYAQDHKPVAEQTEAVGHAVRAAYMYAGMAEVVAETGSEPYRRALDALFDDVVGTKIYITGAIGATRAGEAFGDAYDLPNDSAYAETCAAIALALWAQRMLLIEPDARYADIVERAMYNGFLVGVSLEGDRFFYPNPLQSDGVTPFNQGSPERSEWFACACCPSNDVRFFPRLLSYLYATDRAGNFHVNQFMASEATVSLNGVPTRIIQHTNYPWDGRIRIEVIPERPVDAAIRVRIPGWARGEVVPSDLYAFLDEDPASLADQGLDRGYRVFERTWSGRSEIQLNFPMTPRRVRSHDAVVPNRGRVAVQRGPLVYCAEGADHDGRVLNLVLPDDAPLTARSEPDSLGGITAIHATGLRRRIDLDTRRAVDEPMPIKLIPFYAWNNRGPNEMAVWLPRTPDLIEVPPDPTLASLSRVRVSHTWSADTPAAINDLKRPADSSDQSIPRHTWWPRRGSIEWAELHLPEPTAVSSTSVYWFDDTGVGLCRVPASWTLQARIDGQWRTIATSDQPAIDRFERVAFDPVTTDALRIEARLRPTYSGGILEWAVNE